jgi:hypothetical protein
MQPPLPLSFLCRPSQARTCLPQSYVTPMKPYLPVRFHYSHSHGHPQPALSWASAEQGEGNRAPPLLSLPVLASPNMLVTVIRNLLMQRTFSSASLSFLCRSFQIHGKIVLRRRTDTGVDPWMTCGSVSRMPHAALRNCNAGVHEQMGYYVRVVIMRQGKTLTRQGKNTRTTGL